MTNTKHTPGPLDALLSEMKAEDARHTFRDPQWRVRQMVETLGVSAEEARAMAAAPDLLAALERMEEQFRGRCTYPGDKDAILAARAAIARAKGESK